MEMFTVLDCRARITDESISREEAHKRGVWHGAFHCLLVYARAGREYVLFQKRSGKKKIAPGRFDVSVGGHYAAGESAVIAGPREIKEELGLDVTFEELLPLGRRIFVYCFTPGVKEYEFQDVFLLPGPVEPEKIIVQESEIEGLLEMEVETGIRLFGRKTGIVECRWFKNSSMEEPIAVSVDDFVPCLDNYYLKLLLLAKRYFNGERKYLVI